MLLQRFETHRDSAQQKRRKAAGNLPFATLRLRVFILDKKILVHQENGVILFLKNVWKTLQPEGRSITGGAERSGTLGLGETVSLRLEGATQQVAANCRCSAFQAPGDC